MGSGKSSLIAALLGELRPLSGHADVPGIPNTNTTTTSRTQRVGAPAAGIAYAPQSPWLFTGSVWDNITLYAGEGEVREDCYQLVSAANTHMHTHAHMHMHSNPDTHKGTPIACGLKYAHMYVDTESPVCVCVCV